GCVLSGVPFATMLICAVVPLPGPTRTARYTLPLDDTGLTKPAVLLIRTVAPTIGAAFVSTRATWMPSCAPVAFVRQFDVTRTALFGSTTPGMVVVVV